MFSERQCGKEWRLPPKGRGKAAEAAAAEAAAAEVKLLVAAEAMLLALFVAEEAVDLS